MVQVRLTLWNRFLENLQGDCSKAGQKERFEADFESKEEFLSSIPIKLSEKIFPQNKSVNLTPGDSEPSRGLICESRAG